MLAFQRCASRYCPRQDNTVEFEILLFLFSTWAAYGFNYEKVQGRFNLQEPFFERGPEGVEQPNRLVLSIEQPDRVAKKAARTQKAEQKVEALASAGYTLVPLCRVCVCALCVCVKYDMERRCSPPYAKAREGEEAGGHRCLYLCLSVCLSDSLCISLRTMSSVCFSLFLCAHVYVFTQSRRRRKKAL